MALATSTNDHAGTFAQVFGRFAAEQPTLILMHNDADGLAAGAIFARSFARAGRDARVRILGRGENPWSQAMRSELREETVGGLIVADLGVRAGPIAEGVPTLIVDHHVPQGEPGDAMVISGHGVTPTPTSSLLAFWCSGALGPVGDLLWIAAMGIIGDLGDKAEFEELALARKRYGVTALREATSLVNAPRRSALGDAGPAFDLLMKADDPRDLISGRHEEMVILQRAREEVNAAVQAGRRVAPKIKGDVALIRLHSPCQIHPLVAQSWRGRLKDKIVIAANTGYRPGWVHFSARSAKRIDLVEFLARKAPRDACEAYGSGHQEATGGALEFAGWNEFVANLGFGPDMQVGA